MRQVFVAAAALLGSAFACPDHKGLWKRSEGSIDFDYEFPEDWGHISEEYELCFTGTQQTPLRLSETDGVSRYHTPSFNYPKSMSGHLASSGTSLIYTLSESTNTTSNPSFSFEEGDRITDEVYLLGWHLHSPSEHTIDGERAKAEMHFVHTDAEGNARSVLGFLIQPSPHNHTQSSFFNQIPQPFPELGSETQQTMTLDPTLALKDVGGFEKFWTYEGSLSTPPCTEGLRWFVSQEPLYVDIDTLQSILGVSKYSSRPTQQYWMHALNE